MNLLLDECVDKRLARELRGHHVRTVPQMKWASILNGELLSLAEQEFDVFIATDSNLSFQQNLVKFNVAVIVLHGRSNRLADLKPLVPALLDALPTAPKGQVTDIR
jgi:hypothetical protein